MLEATAARAERSAFGGLPADGLERLPSLIVREVGDLGEIKGPGRFERRKFWAMASPERFTLI